jgi:hypothetical protein
MTQHERLPDLDAAAAAAARGLRRHVDAHLDVDDALEALPTGAPRHTQRRFLAVAAAVALLVGSIAVLNRGGEAGRVRVDLDEALPDIEPSVLRPLGPRDGKDSIRLPLTVEPASTGLVDGDQLTVTASGFVPGESVGIVQCAKEAGADAPEVRGGIDGCYIGSYTSATADDAGVATGTYVVHRVLTTPMTGTVDCAADAGRCIVAMGAINDYDRSGGHAIEFAPTDEPIELPTVEVTPAEGLGHGDVVHVTADGLAPGSPAYIEICSTDPAACWQTGETFDVEMHEDGEDYTAQVTGLPVDEEGHLEGDVPVWRFLPGPEPGTYVDCAVSRCSVRINGELAPPTVPLQFDGAGPAPTAPSLAVDPADGLAPGDEVFVRGAGFEPGSRLVVTFCTGPTAQAEMGATGCSGGDETEVAEDGTFRTAFEIPEMTSDGLLPGTCTPEDGCEVAGDQSEPIHCDGERWTCSISIDPYYAGEPGTTPPVFQAPPVTITYR